MVELIYNGEPAFLHLFSHGEMMEFYSCSRCGATVEEMHTDDHYYWHLGFRTE